MWYIKKREMNCFTFPVKGSERDFGLHVIQTTGPFLCLNIKPGYKIQNSPYFDCSIICIFPRRPRPITEEQVYLSRSLTPLDFNASSVKATRG